MITPLSVLAAFAALALQTAPPSVSEPPVGARLEEGPVCYALQMRAGETSRTVGRTLQVVRRESFEGRSVVKVIVHQQLQDGAFDVRDVFLLEASDLRPIRYVSRRNGEVTVDVTYGADSVTGYRIADDGRRQDLSVTLTEPVWEGNLWGVVFGALPLSESSQLSLPFWHYEKGFGRFSVRVVGSETVSGPDGEVAAWIVEATDGSGPTVTYRIGRARGSELSYAAGGFAQAPGGDCEGLTED